jgi:hypothetical protein
VVRITRIRLVAAIAVVLCLLIAPLVIFSGVSPVGTTLADYLGGRASSATCSGSLQAGTGLPTMKAWLWPVVMHRTSAA